MHLPGPDRSTSSEVTFETGSCIGWRPKPPDQAAALAAAGRVICRAIVGTSPSGG
jgi:hypothetical protein